MNTNNDAFLAAAKTIITYTPPLYVEVKDNLLRPVASGFFAKYDHHHFLITAAHTLKDFSGKKLGVVFNNRFLTIGGEVSLTRSARVGDNKFDIGFYNLDQEFITQLPDTFAFLNLKGINSNPEDQTGLHYMVAGHPASRITFRPWERKINLYPFLLISNLNMSNGIFANNGFRNVSHQLVNYRPRRIHNYYTKENIQGPKPNGLSGCGIWNISSLLESGQQQPSFYPTGIVIEYIKEASVLIATKIGVVIELLRHSYDLDIPKSTIFRARENEV